MFFAIVVCFGLKIIYFLFIIITFQYDFSITASKRLSE